MNWRATIFLSLIISAVLGFFIFLGHSINEDDRQSVQREHEWLQFSRQNHCRIVRDQSFSNPTTLWECDGNFQVRR